MALNITITNVSLCLRVAFFINAMSVSMEDVIMLNVIMLNVTFFILNSELCYAECYDA